MIISNLVPALGWTLLHSLWQGALLFLVVGSVLMALKNSSPKLRYWIVCSALIIFAGGVTITFASIIEVQHNDILSAETTSSSLGETLELSTGAYQGETAANVASESISSVETSSFSLPVFLENNVAYLVALWGLGVFFFAFRWCRMLLLTARLRSEGLSQLSAEWQQRLAVLSKRMQINAPISLAESDRIDTPLVIGYLKPIILLPIGLVNGLSTVQVEAILSHELAHIQRRDYLINLFFTSLEVVFFYHPFYWWIMHKINEERELCCDDVAVAACGNPRMYAHTLLSVEEHRHSGIFAMAFSREGGPLEQRIKRICRVMPRHQQPAPLKMLLALPLFGFAAAITYAGVAPDRGGQTISTVTPTPVEALVLPEQAMPDAFPCQEASPTDPAPVQEAELFSPEGEAGPDERLEITTVERSARRDSLPKPTVPEMAVTPSLPTIPTFDLEEQELKELMDEGEAGRHKVKEATSAFRDRLKEWNAAVKTEFLGSWSTHRNKIIDAYQEWSKELRASTDTELAYALAHEDLVRVYENAFQDHEDVLEAFEDAIEEAPEDVTEDLERLIEREEKLTKEHGERMQVHGIRMEMHSARMQIHSSRMQVHTGRMQMHTARMQMHSQRMKSHKVIMAALEAELRSALLADGLLQKGEQKFSLRVTHEGITFNGKTIKPGALEDKYRSILAKYGKGPDKEMVGNTFMIEIDGKGRKMESGN